MISNIWILRQSHRIQITNPDLVLSGDKSLDLLWSHWLSLCRRVVYRGLETLRQSGLPLTNRLIASDLGVETVLFPCGKENKITKPFHLFFA